MNNNIGTEFKRLLEIRCCKCIVAYYLNVFVVSVCKVCNSLDISYFKVRVCRCFKINCNSIFF